MDYTDELLILINDFKNNIELLRSIAETDAYEKKLLDINGGFSICPHCEEEDLEEKLDELKDFLEDRLITIKNYLEKISETE